MITHSPILRTDVQLNGELIKEIEQAAGFEVVKYQHLSGGSINAVFLLNTSKGPSVLKLNEKYEFPGMFTAERDGLQEIRNSHTLDVPVVYQTGEIQGYGFLMMEYKSGGTRQPNFWEQLGYQLAEMHQHTANNFGFYNQNYIGSLPQFNRAEHTASDFYINQRLEPQIKLAADKGFSLPASERIYDTISAAIPDEPPALVHGDLWSGNCIVNEAGGPCLIDPAVAYAPREMDLAMMRLFGGFPEEVFRTYHSSFPLQAGFEERISLWQLYYLLVHLNIFGRSYFPQVKEILDQYS